MKVILAGYNIDASIIDRAKAGEDVSGFPLTPETVSVAYARISRDPLSVTELRQKSINDVEAARRSARTIVFEMNHQSVAEHAAFNFDILDISRLCVESLEWHRLCSYTEKSQRYQELFGDYYIPKELEDEGKALFSRTLEAQNELYAKAYPILLEHFKARFPNMTEKKRDLRTIESFAKEDARYAVGLATKAQLGFSANARNLEYLIRKLRANPLDEVRALGDEFFRLAGAVAPSLILLSDPVEYEKEFGRKLDESYFKKTRPDTIQRVDDLLDCCARVKADFPSSGDVKLVDWTREADRITIQTILHSHSLAPAETCQTVAGELIESGKAREFIRDYLTHANPWESATREFEAADFTFEVVLSSACYGQMKRHRMNTQLVQEYDTLLGFTFPPSVIEAGLEDEFRENYERTSEAYHELAGIHREAAQYVLTNGHRRRMIIKANARELYHISRLREDAHAQWDIRNISGDMLALAREKAPLTLMLAWGKDRFGEKKREVFEL